MNPVRKFKFLEAALIVCNQYPDSVPMICEDGSYTVGRVFSKTDWSTLREDGRMWVGKVEVAK